MRATTMKDKYLNNNRNCCKEISLFYLLLVSLSVFFVSCAGRKPILNNETSSGLTLTNKQDSFERKETPVIPGDFADPSIIRKGNVYYATGTSSEWAPHFPLFKSTDLLHWQSIGYVFSKTPSWASASFWAPELFYWKGTYLVYYVARKKKDRISCIGVATSKDPSKGFTEQGILLEFGKEAIDPFVLEDNGELYITFKAYGLDQRPIELLGCKLSNDGLKVEGEPFTLLRDDGKRGLEGQCLVKRDGQYYLFYSVGDCCGAGCNYEVEVARSTELKGPYTKFANNPVLTQTKYWKCTGHGTIVTSREGKDFYLYHAYSKTDDVYTGRQGMLDQVVWDNQTGWPSMRPWGENLEMNTGFRDDFSKPVLNYAWRWDFRNSQINWKIRKGILSLSGKPVKNNLTGTALTVLPVSGSYEITTEVVNNNASLKGLVLYGDADEAVGIGIKDNVVQVWEVKKNTRSILKEEVITANKHLQLKMKVEKGSRCRFYWRLGERDWNQMKLGVDYYNGDFLPPWDRSPRPGLIQQGIEIEPADFSFFDITYNKL